MKHIVRKLALAALLFALPGLAANPAGLLNRPSQTLNITPVNGVAGVCEDGNTAVSLATTVGATVGVQIVGTWTGTIGFFVRVGSLAPAGGAASAYQAAQATPYPTSGSAVSTTTANGTWQIPVAGAQGVCVAFTNAASSGTATITINVTTAPSASGGGGGGSLPAGASTSALQTTINATLNTINTTLQAQSGASGASVPVFVASGSLPAAPPGTVSPETIACNSNVSPCPISTAAVGLIFNNSTSRKSCTLQNVGTLLLFCRKGSSGISPASTSVYDFLLGPAGTSPGSGGAWQCDSPGGIWQGAVNCIAASTGASVAVSGSD